MTSGLGLWGVAAIGSGLVHLAALGLFQLSLQPNSAPQQPTPQSNLSLTAHPVRRSQAIPQPPTAETGKLTTAVSDEIAASAVPHSKPAALDPVANPIRPTRPKAADLTATPPQNSFAESQALIPNQIAPLSPQLGRQSAVSPPQEIARLMTPDSPKTAPLVTTTQSVTLPIAISMPEPALQSSPQAITVTAALAFQGNTAGQVDPVSLTAFQSFTRPADSSTRAGGLRDSVSSVLSNVACARLQVVFNPDTASLELRGHLPSNDQRSSVLTALQAQMGNDIVVADKMRLLPRPQCGALSGISNLGLPQSTDQITNPLLLGPDAQARVLSYTGGEQLFFDLTAPDYPSYLYVDYFDAAGEVIHLAPNALAPLSLTAAQANLRIGAKTPQDPGLQILIGPPYGQEIAVAFAASSPLYDLPRPQSEAAAPYLDFLRKQIAKSRSQDSDFKGEWVYFLVETQAN